MKYAIRVHIAMSPNEPLPQFLQHWLAREITEPPKKKTRSITLAEPAPLRSAFGTSTSMASIRAFTMSESTPEVPEEVAASEGEEEEEEEIADT